MAEVRSRSISSVLGVAIVAIFGVTAIAQAPARLEAAAPKVAAPSGELSGLVVDAQGKPLAGAAVTMLKAGEDKPKSAVSGADGSFKFDALPSGVFIGAAAMDGYSPVTCRGIRLVAGQSRRLEIKLMPTGGEPSTCNNPEPAEPGA